MKIFSLKNGKISKGATVASLELKGAGISIPALIIGEEGRGRSRGVLPVQLTESQHKEWKEKGEVTIGFAKIGETRSGKPKLLSLPSSENEEGEVICVFNTQIGFRGGNEHTGDIDKSSGLVEPFPGKIISSGVIAQGAAGRMGYGDQLVAIIPEHAVFRTAYSGRLYGEPAEHFFKVDDGQLLVATLEEREAADLF